MTILDRFRLDGRVAVVTGANRGLGRSIATALAEAGAHIGLAARDTGSLQELTALLAQTGAKTAAAPCDVTDPESVEAAVARFEETLGPVDIWINNAGITYWGPTLEADPAGGWETILATNAGGVFNCSQAVGRRMAARGSGTIINIGSISGLIVNRPQWQAAYNASKAAVHHLTRSLAVELAPAGVRVNALAPGFIATDMVSEMFDVPEYKEEWIDRVPLKRAADPMEISSAAVFLASEAASFMTGSVVVVDGGYTLT
ncbi:SDR family NAD(P)-dependent oxidoreductase [Arthrobacter mobilis]|uniref:SDR family oxidoreductase n=1 Tax=Arthrobacter mobilis TaxID=2724944 RepID=A0A7X6HC60_9MICC|nr:SDR family oxidoreductase [Arthrobacter mobilis]NKX54394.1 SDR family oxidoreductase [Arthrobacter mobilis]